MFKNQEQPLLNQFIIYNICKQTDLDINLKGTTSPEGITFLFTDRY